MATILKELDKQQLERDILARFEKLSDKLKTALDSERNKDAVVAIGNSYNLTSDQIDAILQIVGEVLLGYLRPNEVALELINYFDIEKTVAQSIERDVNQKIFTIDIKADLEKNYKPVQRTEIEAGAPAEIQSQSHSIPSLPAQEQKTSGHQKSFSDFLKPAPAAEPKIIDQIESTKTPEPVPITPPKPIAKLSASPTKRPTPTPSKEPLSSRTVSVNKPKIVPTKNTSGKKVSDENTVDLRQFIGRDPS